jgi:hypothetical protein
MVPHIYNIEKYRYKFKKREKACGAAFKAFGG